MSKYKVGDRVRIDEELGGEVDFPYVGVGRLLHFSGESWEIEVEWIKDGDGDTVFLPGDTYLVFESEIAEVLGE